MACSQPNLSASWLANVYNQGWRFEFIWVGLQAPCTTYQHRFSSNAQTAYGQGKNEAISAVNQLILNLGVTNPAQGTAVTFDLDVAPSACQAATSWFISGWDYQLSLSPAQKSGVYGAVCASNLQYLAYINSVPNYIWGSDPDGTISTKDLWYDPGNCGVTSGSWSNHQRLKQWEVNNSESWGGENLGQPIDENCADTWMNPSGNGVDQACIS